MRYINCHAHTFNMRYVPDKFLKVHFNERIAEIVHQLLNARFISGPLIWLLKQFIRKGTSAKMLAFLTIGIKKTQDMVFDDLRSNYLSEDDVPFIILPLDFTFMGAGELNIPYEQQLEDLFELKLKYPNHCLPFVAIDPRRGTATENKQFVESYIKRGFAGIKLYPALGYFAFDPGLKEVFQYAEINNIPLLTHCSSGGINYVGDSPTNEMINPQPFNRIDGRSYSFPQNGKEMSLYCDQFNNPTYFEEALIEFPKLKICFAHFGLNASNQFNKNKDHDVPRLEWFTKILELMQTYKNVYTDISYSIAYIGFINWFLIHYNSWPADIQNRIMFGTDYYMTIQEEYGNDNEIMASIKREMPLPVFQHLAYDNVLAFLATNNSPAPTPS